MAAKRGTNGGSTKKPRVVHVLGLLGRSGDTIVVRGLVGGLSGKYHHTVLYQEDAGDKVRQDFDGAAEFICCPYPPGKPWRFLASCIRALRTQAPDVVLAHVFGNHILVSIAARFAGVSRTYAVAAGSPIHYTRKRWRAVLISHIARLFCRGEIAVSETVYKSLVEDVHLPARRVKLIRNGCDVEAVAKRVRQARTPGSGAKRSRILMAARLAAGKDHPTLFRAVRLLRSEGREVELLLAGDGVRRKEYEALVIELGIAERVRFLGNRNDVPELMARCEALVLATHTEGLPLILLEAMAAEIPIVATDIPACRGVLDDGRSGLLAPRADSRAMATAIGNLLDDADLRGRLVSAAAERVRRCYGIGPQLEGYASLFAGGGAHLG